MQERMNSQKPLASWYAPGLSDSLGDRLLMFDNTGAPSLELLRFRPELVDIPGFEAALREQVKRLGQFRHSAFARIRSVQRLEPDDDLALVSNCPSGKRLSEVLHRARGPAFASTLLQQLAPALVLFQQHEPGAAHGVLNPDRIVVSPEGRLTIVEQVVGPAIEAVEPRPSQLASLGIVMPPSPDALSPLGVVTDWYQLGLIAVSVLIGRPVTSHDLPQIEKLLDGVASSARADGSALSPFMRQWLDRALQISGNRLESDADAHAAVDELLRKESPRDSRQAVALRRERNPPQRPVLTPPAERSAERSDEAPASVVAAARVVVEPPSQASRQSEPASHSIEFFPVEEAREQPRPGPQAHVRTQREEPSIFEVRRPQAAPERTPQAREQFEQEALAGKRLLEFKSGVPVYDTPAETAPQRPARRRIPMGLVAGLAIVAVVEAGVIAWMARAQWHASSQPVFVETAATGDHMVVTSRSTEGAPLRLTVAPDLRWVRVTPPSANRVLGGRVTEAEPGALRIASTIALKAYAGSRLLGSVPGADFRMPAGAHEIALVNEELGVRLKQTIEIGSSETVSLHVAPPHGYVTIDATPWAEVSIDGQSVGRTPLGPLPLSLGEHLITFRHPAGSKDQQRITVKSEVTTKVVGEMKF